MQPIFPTNPDQMENVQARDSRIVGLADAERIRALYELAVLDTPPEPEFDAIVKAASIVCGMPVSLISLIDCERQWFKANHGLVGVNETPREQAFCAYAIYEEGLFVVPDAELDARFAQNPLVVGAPRIRFYAGAPLKLSNGNVAGTLCVIDHQPRELDLFQREALTSLALAATRALEGRHARLMLAQSNALLNTTLNSIADAVLTLDMDGQLTWMNLSAEKMLERSNADVRGCLVESVMPLRTMGSVVSSSQLLSNIRNGERIVFPPDTVLMRGVDADAPAVEGTVTPLRVPSENKAASIKGAVIVLRDITAARRNASELLHRATHDSLTGLANRSEFEYQLRQRLALTTECNMVGYVLFIDLDHFKLVNDSCGHQAGDEVLKQIAGMLGESVRSGDTLARLGGDEFSLLLEPCLLNAAVSLAERICERLEILRFNIGGKRFRIGASIGVAPVGGALPDVASVMQAADECCHLAKEDGRNRVVAWSTETNSTEFTGGASNWVERIGRALDEERFILYGQCVEPLRHGVGVRKIEVLLRLQDERGGVVAPGAFMPAAERFQLMSRIDRWVVSRTLQWMKEHLATSSVKRVGVNLSGQSIADKSFRLWIIDELLAAGQPLCTALTVEVTETVAIRDVSEAARFLQELRDLGLRVALDDFGSGASTFGYLKHFPLDYIKIDGQFVRNLLVDPLDEATIRCFVDVARVTGLKTVAECVESAEVLERLRQLGVDFAQGYYLHRPAPITTFSRTDGNKVLE